MRFKVADALAVRPPSAFHRFVSGLVRRTPLAVFRQKRILLLEDDPSMQRLIAKVLRPIRARVEHFGNGRAVVARIASRRVRYAALLLDVMMPHDGGLTVLRNLRDHEPSLLRKVILVTASGTGITNPWSDLIYAVVQKPFDTSELVATVRACVGENDETQPRGGRSVSRLVKCISTQK